MKHNPKVVNFNRSPAFAYHRAMINRRENNPLDALELLRSAAEHSPENAEYRLQLARQYAEIGWYEESCRLALDVLSEADAPADAYLLLADSLISIGRSDAAEALMLYALAHIEDESFILAAQRMLFEISMANRPEARKNRRAEYAERIAMRALKHLGEGEVEKAIQIFESCPPLSKNQSRIRVQYAAALCAANETDRAVSELETALEFDNSPEIAVMSAELFHSMGDTPRAQSLLRGVLDTRDFSSDDLTLAYALYETGMYEECANFARLALQENPHDRAFLHVRAVALSRAGAPDSRCARYWLHILRIDPEDTVAKYYLSVAEKGELRNIEPDCLYKVPQEEFLRRSAALRSYMKNDDSVLVHSWQSIPEFRSLVRWAAQSSAAALQIFAGFALSGCDDAAAQSLLRQLLITQDLPSRAKIEIILLARIHGITVGGALGNYFSHLISRSGASDQERALCVGDRKLIAGVREYLEDEYQLSEGSLPAFLWLSYRRNPETKSDLVPSMEAAMGALSYYCLKARNISASVEKLHRQIGGSRRKMNHYIRRFARALNVQKGENQG